MVKLDDAIFLRAGLLAKTKGNLFLKSVGEPYVKDYQGKREKFIDVNVVDSEKIEWVWTLGNAKRHQFIAALGRETDEWIGAVVTYEVVTMMIGTVEREVIKIIKLSKHTKFVITEELVK